MSVAHDCSFVLDARLQSGDLVQDAKGGVRFGRKRATVKAGAPSFDLNFVLRSVLRVLERRTQDHFGRKRATVKAGARPCAP